MFIRLITIGAVLVVAFYLLRAFYAYAVEHGWLYGRGQAPRRGNTVGFEQIFEQEIAQLIEEIDRIEIEADQDESGTDE